MTADQIPHGTYSGYMYHQCRCDLCEPARRAYGQHMARQKAYGQWNPYGDRDQVLDHIAHLRKGGWSVAQIAHEADVSKSGLHKLINGTVKQVRTSTADAVLAVSGPPPTDDAPVAKRAAAGAYRRVWALTALGWTASAIACRAGLSLEAVCRVRRGERDTIASTTHDAIADAYREMSRGAPENPSAAMVRAAVEGGHPPPAGWDDHWLDLPDDELAAELARLVGGMGWAELKRNYRAMLEGERSPLVVAAAKEFNRQRTARNRQGKAAA